MVPGHNDICPVIARLLERVPDDLSEPEFQRFERFLPITAGSIDVGAEAHRQRLLDAYACAVAQRPIIAETALAFLGVMLGAR